MRANTRISAKHSRADCGYMTLASGRCRYLERASRSSGLRKKGPDTLQSFPYKTDAARDAQMRQSILFQGVIAVQKYENRTVWRLPSTPAKPTQSRYALGADSLKWPVAELKASRRTASRVASESTLLVDFRALFMAWEIY
jgi:hypothetical protein